MIQSKLTRLFFTFCIFTVLIVTLWSFQTNNTRPALILKETKIDDYHVQIEKEHFENYQIVYFTTKFFKREYIHYRDNPTIFRKPHLCADKYPKCLITRNNAHMNTAHAYISHWRDFIQDKVNMPPGSTSNTTKPSILINFEPPPHCERLPSNLWFHVVANYRLDADLYVPYGGTRRLEVSNTAFDELDYWTNKTLPVAWMVSNCQTQNRRENYVRELRKYIQVDIYGKCGNFKCERKTGENSDCLQMLSKKYFFYLSFENSFHKDYLTEKIFLLGNYSILPVVYGGANYQNYLPNNSFIDATKYSPQELATIMKTLMADKDKYNDYFKWKRDYEIYSTPILDNVYCNVCEILQNTSRVYSPKSSQAINDWFFIPPNKPSFTN